MSLKQASLMCLVACAGASGLSPPKAQAAVYICLDSGCLNPTLATPAELDIKSHDAEKTKIRDTLQNSSAESLVNGFNSIAGTDLDITKYWHEGGDDPFKGFEHITVKVYKNNEYVKTCHAFSYRKGLTGPYHATCTN